MFCTSNYHVVSIVMLTLFTYVITLSFLLDWLLPQYSAFASTYATTLWILILNLAAFPLTPLFLTKLWALETLATSTNVSACLLIFIYNIIISITYLIFFKKLMTVELNK